MASAVPSLILFVKASGHLFESSFGALMISYLGLSLSLLARQADTQGRVAVATRCADSDSRECV